MTINPIATTGLLPSSEGLSQTAATGMGGGAFSKVIEHFLQSTGVQQMQANQAVRELALGQTDNLHNVLLEVAKADLAFRLILEIRNRLSDAYQEIMRMQV